MTTEYWLQKKTLGGWSHVTRYNDLEQVTKNYNNCSKGDSGYSWRIMKCEVIEEKLLFDHEEVEEIQEPLDAISRVPLKELKSGWGNVKSSGWGNDPSPASLSFVNTPSSSEVQHGMVGKVWMINHKTKERKRIDPGVDLGVDWERGGPKTPFRS